LKGGGGAFLQGHTEIFFCFLEKGRGEKNIELQLHSDQTAKEEKSGKIDI
jgi:hypothetical protein